MAKNYESESKNSRNYTGTSDKNSYGNEMNHAGNAKNSIAGLMICDAALFFIFFFSYSFSYAPANSLFLNIYQISDSTAALSIERPFI